MSLQCFHHCLRKKMHCSSGEINFTNRQNHRDIGSIVRLGIPSTSIDALCRTFSIMFIRCFWNRFQKPATYSVCGLTTDVNSNGILFFSVYTNNLCMIPAREFVLFTFSLICLSNYRCSLKVFPRSYVVVASDILTSPML